MTLNYDYNKIYRELLPIVSAGNNKEFLKRVYSKNYKVYLQRIRKIGFVSQKNIVEMGSGFGQWTIPLCALNKNVIAIEPDKVRFKFLKKLKLTLNLNNLQIINKKFEDIDFIDSSYDALFSYSVMYLGNWRENLKKINKLLKKNGKLYFNTNDIGWYVKCLVENNNSTKDFSPKKMAIRSIENFLYNSRIKKFNMHSQNLMPLKDTLSFLKYHNFRSIRYGPDGSTGFKMMKANQFFEYKYLGLTSVYEILTKK